MRDPLETEIPDLTFPDEYASAARLLVTRALDDIERKHTAHYVDDSSGVVYRKSGPCRKHDAGVAVGTLRCLVSLHGSVAGSWSGVPDIERLLTDYLVALGRLVAEHGRELRAPDHDENERQEPRTRSYI